MLDIIEFSQPIPPALPLPLTTTTTTTILKETTSLAALKIIADLPFTEIEWHSTLQMSDKKASYLLDRAITNEEGESDKPIIEKVLGSYVEEETIEVDELLVAQVEITQPIKAPSQPERRLQKINDQAARILERIQKIFSHDGNSIVFKKLYTFEKNGRDNELKETIGAERYLTILNHLKQNAPAYFDEVLRSQKSLPILSEEGEQLLIKPSGKVYFRLSRLGQGNFKSTDQYILIASAVSNYVKENKRILRAVSLPNPKQDRGSQTTEVELEKKKRLTIQNQKEILLNHFIKEQSKQFPVTHVNVVKSLSYLGPDIQGTMTEVFDGDVNSQLASQALTLRERYQIGYQMAEGVNELHAMGIVHRDIKPDNFLIRGSGDAVEVKITDFGTSSGPGSLKSRVSVFYNVITDPLWTRTSRRDEIRFSTPSDIYQLGIALCMTLTNTTIDELNLQTVEDMRTHRLPTLLDWKRMPHTWSMMNKIEDEETMQFLLRMVDPFDASRRPSSSEVSQFFKSKSMSVAPDEL